MKILFLDVDGVLNSLNYLIKTYYETREVHSGKNYPFDPQCLSNLKFLVKETNAKIVISSSWRNDPEALEKLLSVLEEHQLRSSVIGCTKKLNGVSRGQEIKAYLEGVEIDSYVILDDNDDMDDVVDHLVLTDISIGLTMENVLDAIKILEVRKSIK